MKYLVLFLCFVAGTTTSEVRAQTAPLTAVSIASTDPTPLTESNLNNAKVVVTFSTPGSDVNAALSSRRPDAFRLLTTGGDSGTGLPGLSLVNHNGSTDRELRVSASRSVSGGTAWEHDLDFFIRYDDSDFDSNGTIAIQVPAAIHTGSTDLTTGTVTVTAVDETAPGQVTGVTVTPGGEQLTVTWTAVSGASGYKVQWKSGSQAYDPDNRQAESTGTSHTITGLTGGTQYTLRVRATKTKADDGSFSDEATGTPGPGQVMGVSVTAGTEQLAVTWTATPGASGYQVQWKSGSEEYNNTRQAATNTNSHTIPSLTGGTEYTLRVRATGTPNGPFSAEATGTPGPGQVMGVTVTSGPGQLQVAWTSVTGATGYKVQWKSGSQVYDNTRQATPTTNSHTIAGLTAGTEYTVQVLATRSSTPDGPASSEATGTPGLAQVTGVRVTAGNRQLQVAWNTVLGASGYKVQWKSGSESYNTTDRQATTANTNYTITNLTPTAYTLRVLATRARLTDGPASNEQVAAPLGNTDYDQNNNNLIDLTTLAQLDAVRYDLDGDGSPTGNVNAYNLAFLGRATDMGCPDTCSGYELMNDLNFDENGNGDRDDTYNQGAGWQPIGDLSNRFTATFQGNGHTITNLFINRPRTLRVGLFGVSAGTLSQLGLVDVEITGGDNTGGLLGQNRGRVSTSYSTGRVRGGTRTGGLVGRNEGNSPSITASYATSRVTGSTNTGGLVGESFLGTITASYAAGQVTGTSSVGGLVGSNVGTITASYWDTETTGQSSSSGSPDTDGKTTAELQTPTDYTGIYADWNIDVDGVTGNDKPWAFGADYQYPVLRHRRTQTQINAQFYRQSQGVGALADVNQDLRIDAQDALLMYRTYLPGAGAGVDADDRERANEWRRQGRAVGGDLNGDGRITEQDALIMYYAYQFRALLQNHAALRQRLFNGLRGSGSQQMPPTDTTYREFLRRALRLR